MHDAKEKISEKNMALYNTIEQTFREEANSLLPHEMIELTLKEEKERLKNASSLSIPASCFIGNNTLRYTKDLLRKKQPFFFLYAFLSFMTELSICLLLSVLCYDTFLFIQGNQNAFGTKMPLGFLLAVFLPLLLCKNIKKSLLCRQLLPPFSEESSLKSRIQHQQTGIILFFSLCSIGSLLLLFFTKNNHIVTASLFTLFILYVSCMLLFGIHNVLYSSHASIFLSIGAFLLTAHQKERMQKMAKHYIELSTQQILGQHKRTIKEYKEDLSLQKKVNAQLLARLTTQRVYAVLAFALLCLLDAVTIYRLVHTLVLTLTIFLICSLLATALALICFLSAHYLRRLVSKGFTK